MDNDDRMIGRILSRRQVLRVLGFAGGSAAMGGLTACVTQASGSSQGPANTGSSGRSGTGSGLPGCIVRPALTEGPYFVDEKLGRSDIRSNQGSSVNDGAISAGTPLRLKFVVSSVGSSCAPLSGVQVDIWHCDAAGVYSDAQDPGFNTKGQNFLRGYQITDANGVAEFLTIYPGWYRGRAVHIHFKLRASANGKAYEFTSQLFFDESITDAVHALAPYSSKGYRTLKNEGDNIYRNGGSQLLIAPTKNGAGYQASFDIGVNFG